MRVNGLETEQCGTFSSFDFQVKIVVPLGEKSLHQHINIQILLFLILFLEVSKNDKMVIFTLLSPVCSMIGYNPFLLTENKHLYLFSIFLLVTALQHYFSTITPHRQCYYLLSG